MYAQLCLTYCDPMDCNPLGFSVPGISAARILELVAISFCRGSSQLRDQTRVSCVSCIGRWVLYHCATWEALLFPFLYIPNRCCKDINTGDISINLCLLEQMAGKDEHSQSSSGCYWHQNNSDLVYNITPWTHSPSTQLYHKLSSLKVYCLI